MNTKFYTSLSKIFILCSLFFFLKGNAQAPDGMTYQAVIRNNVGALITNVNVGMKFSILKTTSTGTLVYSETQMPTTNANGLATAIIGNGTVVSGNFSTIDWSAGPYYIKTETDPTGGTNYSITSTTQLMSVPYALYAKTSGSTASTNAWGLSGNAGTDPAINFIGTTDFKDLIFKVNNQKSGCINSLFGNTTFGYESLITNTNGSNNTAIGAYTLVLNSIGSNNVANGYQTLYHNDTGSQNVAIGDNALYYNISGYHNVANGTSALFNNTTGLYNVANGSNALYNNTIGNYNVASGRYALFSNTTGSFNNAYGYRSLFTNNTGELNVAMGSEALHLSNSNWNTAVGSQSCKNVTTGEHNVGFGGQTLLNVATGSNNIAVGTTCGPTGDFSNTITFGDNAFSNQSNKVRIGNTNVTAIEGQVGFSTVSDGRFKTNVTESVVGLDFIKKLRPVVYNFDTKKFADFLRPDQSKEDKQDYTQSTAIRHVGFIAQEVYEAAQKSGFDFNGVHKPGNDRDNWSITYDKMVVPLVKAVQEQQTMIEKQQAQIDELKKENVEMKTMIQSLINKK